MTKYSSSKSKSFKKIEKGTSKIRKKNKKIIQKY